MPCCAPSGRRRATGRSSSRGRTRTACSRSAGSTTPSWFARSECARAMTGPGDTPQAPPPALLDSIATRLLKVIFACYFIVTVVVTCIQLVAEYRHTEARLLREIEAMQHTFGPGI